MGKNEWGERDGNVRLAFNAWTTCPCRSWQRTIPTSWNVPIRPRAPSKDNSQGTWCVINGTEKGRLRDVGMRFVWGGRKVDNVTPTGQRLWRVAAPNVHPPLLTPRTWAVLELSPTGVWSVLGSWNKATYFFFTKVIITCLEKKKQNYKKDIILNQTINKIKKILRHMYIFKD